MTPDRSARYLPGVQTSQARKERGAEDTHAGQEPGRATAGGSRSRNGLWVLAILLVTAAVYARGLAGELVYDDRYLIGRNPLIADLRNLPKLFASGYWDFLDLREAQYIGYWRPLTAVVQALLWPFAGVDGTLYHAASLAIHLGAVAAAFGVVLRLGASRWVAGATALLFALHPAHVESVAWISALNDPLFGCLALLAIERFLAWRQAGSRGIPVASLLFFALALLAKELAAALVPLLVLLDLLRPRAPGESEAPVEAPPDWPARLRTALAAFSLPHVPLRAYGPFAAAFAAYLGARMAVFASPWAGFDRITTDFMVSGLRLALLRLEIFGGGLEILTIPIHLNLFRPFRPHIDAFDPDLVRAAVFTALFLALLVASFLGRRRLALAALLVLPAGLLPALIKVNSLGIFPLSERFLYLPVFGFALGTAVLLARSFSTRVASVLLVALAAGYGARSYARIGFWHDEETLFRQAAQDSPRSVYVQWGLARVLLERLNATRDARYLAEANQVLETAASLLEQAKAESTDLMVSSRDFLQVNLELAWCSIYADDWSAAILVLEDLVGRVEAIQAQEREARALGVRVREQFLDLDKVYTALGVAQYSSGDFAKAERSFLHALELQPSAPETHQNLGRMYAVQGRWAEAAHEFEASAKLRPGNTEDRLLLAQTLQTMGQSERAAELARQLLRELPDRPEPLVILATGARQDSAQALAWLDRALELDPRNALAWYQKARALLSRDDKSGALSAFRNAVELDPASFEAHYDLGAFLLSEGALSEARPYLVRAYTLAPPEHRPPLRQNLAQMEFDDVAELLELAAADSKRNELGPALTWLERACGQSPENVSAALARSRLLRRMERHEEALAALRAVAEKAPASYELWSELGTYLWAQGRTDEARPVIEHALGLELPPGLPAELRQSSKQRLRELLERPDGAGQEAPAR